MEVQLVGKSALVAGATGGLGSAIAAELHSRGADLTLVSRSADALDRLDVAGHRLALDLRDPANCKAAVEATLLGHRQLDILVNAIGVVAFGSTAELSVDTLDELFLTNSILPILLCRAALPEMSRGGVIINISGAIAERNLPGMAAYGASKGALRSFDEAFAREARRSGVRVIDARPPHTETGLAERAIEGTSPALGRGLDPAVVAGIICDAITDELVELTADSFVAAPTGGAPAQAGS